MLDVKFGCPHTKIAVGKVKGENAFLVFFALTTVWCLGSISWGLQNTAAANYLAQQYCRNSWIALQHQLFLLIGITWLAVPVYGSGVWHCQQGNSSTFQDQSTIQKYSVLEHYKFLILLFQIYLGKIFAPSEVPERLCIAFSDPKLQPKKSWPKSNIRYREGNRFRFESQLHHWISSLVLVNHFAFYYFYVWFSISKIRISSFSHNTARIL